MADLFKDGFESGNTSAWSSETDDENDLTVTEAAALHGTYGLAALIDNNASMFVTDTTPASETRYRCRFYINPNGLTMGNNESIIILNARKDPTSASFYVEFKYTTVAGYQIKVYDRTDDTWAKVSNYYVISNASHCIEVDWTAATGDGANNGTFTLWIDGVEKQTVAAINNDTEVIDHVCFGCQSGIGAGTSGTMFFDDFASNNDGAEIGVISEGTDFTYSGTGSFAYSGTATQSNG
ncbi:MAG: hypothetical protein IMZ64_00535, partial [Bacteroidetes bacterium]|nr:hypothetical protein [Bacteroidota bacterium]